MSRRPAPVDPVAAAMAAAAGEAAMEVAHRFGSPVPLRVWQAQRMTSNTQPARHIVWTGRRAYWRELGADLWEREGGGVRLTRDRPGRVVVWFGFPAGYRGRTRDPLNLAPIVKHLVDGMVDAGLTEDDVTVVSADPRADDDVEYRRLSVLGPGHSFGEFGLLADGRHAATVTAREELHTWVLTPEVLTRLETEDPSLALRLWQAISRDAYTRIRSQMDEIAARGADRREIRCPRATHADHEAAAHRTRR